jgi:hypothetical protein
MFSRKVCLSHFGSRLSLGGASVLANIFTGMQVIGSAPCSASFDRIATHAASIIAEALPRHQCCRGLPISGIEKWANTEADSTYGGQFGNQNIIKFAGKE